jgi:hypothetical protein
MKLNSGNKPAALWRCLFAAFVDLTVCGAGSALLYALLLPIAHHEISSRIANAPKERPWNIEPSMATRAGIENSVHNYYMAAAFILFTVAYHMMLKQWGRKTLVSETPRQHGLCLKDERSMTYKPTPANAADRDHTRFG